MVIRANVNISFPWRLTVGNHVWIGEDVGILSLADVVIEDNVCISQRAYLCTGSHDYHREDFKLITRPITVARGELGRGGGVRRARRGNRRGGGRVGGQRGHEVNVAAAHARARQPRRRGPHPRGDVMRFLFLNQYAPPEIPPTARLLGELADGLRADGHTVEILSPKARATPTGPRPAAAA